jgi:hypothetical protein
MLTVLTRGCLLAPGRATPALATPSGRSAHVFVLLCAADAGAAGHERAYIRSDAQCAQLPGAAAVALPSRLAPARRAAARRGQREPMRVNPDKLLRARPRDANDLSPPPRPPLLFLAIVVCPPRCSPNPRNSPTMSAPLKTPPGEGRALATASRCPVCMACMLL